MNNSSRVSRSRMHSPLGPALSGFSLIEVMVVVVIIGMLAGAVALKVTGYMDTSRANRAKIDIATIVKGVKGYYVQHSRYPTSDEGIDVVEEVETKTDPWGNDYLYNSPGNSNDGPVPFEVFTLGADGQPGGEGQNADIFSWQLNDAESEN